MEVYSSCAIDDVRYSSGQWVMPSACVDVVEGVFVC